MENRRIIQRFLSISATCMLSCFSLNTFAAYTQTWVNNISGMGNAYAATAAVIDDVSVQYYNPAGLTAFCQPQLVLGASIGSENNAFRGSTLFKPTDYQQTGKASTNVIGGTPMIYYATPLPFWHTAFGWALTAFGGAGQIYPDNSILRYTSTKSMLGVVNTGPSFAVQVTDKLSIGLGLDMNFLVTDINAMSPTGAPGTPDAKSLNSAGNFGYGFHTGLLYAFTPGTRVGLAYRSRTNLAPTGTSTYVLNPGATLKTEFSTSNFHYQTATAPTTTLSIYHKMNNTWAIMGGVDYSEWSILHSLTLNNVATPLGPVNETSVINYHNTWRLSTAVNYKANDDWLLKMGVYYDQDPTDHSVLPADAVSSPNTIKVGIGAHYQLTKNTSVDMACSHYFLQTVNIRFNTPVFGQTGTLKITRKNEAGVQFNFNL